MMDNAKRRPMPQGTLPETTQAGTAQIPTAVVKTANGDRATFDLGRDKAGQGSSATMRPAVASYDMMAGHEGEPRADYSTALAAGAAGARASSQGAPLVPQNRERSDRFGLAHRQRGDDE